MKKKILIFCIISIFMLITISYATAVNNSVKQKKVSPLFRFRSSDAIKNKRETIKSRFIGNRIFYIPVKLKQITSYLGEVFYSCTDCSGFTCRETVCIDGSCTDMMGCTVKTCDNPTSSYTCPGSGFTCNTFFCCP